MCSASLRSAVSLASRSASLALSGAGSRLASRCRAALQASIRCWLLGAPPFVIAGARKGEPGLTSALDRGSSASASHTLQESEWARLSDRANRVLPTPPGGTRARIVQGRAAAPRGAPHQLARMHACARFKAARLRHHEILCSSTNEATTRHRKAAMRLRPICQGLRPGHSVLATRRARDDQRWSRCAQVAGTLPIKHTRPPPTRSGLCPRSLRETHSSNSGPRST